MRRGFTLIEMVVTIGITVVMAGVLLAYNHSSERQLRLSVAQARLIGALTRAKSFALEKYSGGAANPDACAFGVYLDSTHDPARFIIFQARPTISDGCLDEFGEPTFSREYEEGGAVETTILDEGVTIDSTNSILFEAPYLKVYRDGLPITEAAPLTLRSSDGNSTAVVTVGPGGDISAP